MACGSCGGGRSASTTAYQKSTSGQPGTSSSGPKVWRLHYPTGLTVDYWSQAKAQEDQKNIPGSRLVLTDPRTGEPVAG